MVILTIKLRPPLGGTKVSQKRPGQIKNELKAKGVEPELISEIIAEVEPEAEYNAAMALVLKKLQKAAGPYPLPRMAGFLQRRGFSYETISRVCRTLKDSGILSDSTDYYY